MHVNVFLHRRPWPLSFAILVGGLLLLAGCGPEEVANRTDLETELQAGDGTVQTLQRFFFPATYWREKSERLQEQVKQQQAAFNDRARAYHALLQQRRDKVKQAITQAEAVGKAVDEARRTVIQEFRSTLDPVREETRQIGKELRRIMALQAQAEIAARQR
ncbi:MAG: hypothetical protein H7838_02945 [Magnetococcus sp. DMHC-8]